MATLDSISAEIEKNVAIFQEIENIPIPDTVKAAARDNWKLIVDQMAFEGITFYAPEEKSGDSQRIIPVAAVLQIIREMEEEIVRRTVLDPLDIYIKAVFTKAKYARYLILGFSNYEDWWRDIKLAWQIVSHGDEGIIQILQNFFEVVALATLAASANKVMKQRETFAAKMRKRALPSPSGKLRYRRRKVAR